MSIEEDPFYRTCVRGNEGTCKGRITIEHSIIFAGRQLDDMWSLLPVCEFHHGVNNHQDGGDLDKEKHLWVALNRATEDQLRIISKTINYLRERDRLNHIYGQYNK